MAKERILPGEVWKINILTDYDFVRQPIRVLLQVIIVLLL